MGRRGLFILIFGSLLVCCGGKNAVNSRLSQQMPQKILWAWEMPEDVSFADPKEFGVAFLAQTVFLQNDRVIPKKRQQPLKTVEGAYVIAVTRVETYKDTNKRPTTSDDMVRQTSETIVDTLQLPNVKAIQIDFDAVTSERDFYRKLVNEVRNHLPENTPLTMTSLASWCTGDAWFNDFPVDEAVPMVFQMGADSDRIKRYLQNGNDWAEPLCRGSYGISFEEGRFEGMKDGRRMYYFKNTPWRAEDLANISRPSATLAITSACDLSADPTRYDAKVVRFKGSIQNGIEGSWLTHPDCPEDSSSIIASGFSKDAQIQRDSVHPTPGGGEVAGIITGLFKNEPFVDSCLKGSFKIEVLSVDDAVRGGN